MPIYEYQCSACAHRLDALQKISEAPLTECPACHQSSLTRLVSAAGFQLKGSGWYATDYRPKPSANKEEGNASSTTEPTSSDKKSDSTGET
jgi:putative FmdB family regulatory protein